MKSLLSGISRLNAHAWRVFKRPSMRIHLYTISWNEMRMLDFFFRHYDPWVERYVFFDDGSDDGTLELLNRHPRVEVRRFERSDPDSYVESSRSLNNRVWKESRGCADWVVITAVDEHIYHPRLWAFLAAARLAGVTAIPGLGYQMISTDFPRSGEQLSKTRTRGAPFTRWNKLNLFNPNAIEETNYDVGRHTADPRGTVIYPNVDELLILHYKYMGFDHIRSRHTGLAPRLGTTDRKNGWGLQFDFSDARLVAEIEAWKQKAVDISDPNLRPHSSHPPPRWWRNT